MQFLCKEGDKIGIGNVTLEVLGVTDKGVEVCIDSEDGSRVEVFCPSDEDEEQVVSGPLYSATT